MEALVLVVFAGFGLLFFCWSLIRIWGESLSKRRYLFSSFEPAATKNPWARAGVSTGTRVVTLRERAIGRNQVASDESESPTLA